MQTTILQMRKNYGWTQQQLADRCSCARERISVLETGRTGPQPDELQRIARAFQLQPHDLEVREPRPRGGQSRPGRALLAEFTVPPPLVPVPRYNGLFRLAACRRSYPKLMERLDPQLAANAEWQQFLEAAASDSADETLLHLLELERGARVTRVTLNELGFDQWPSCEFFGKLRNGWLHPALVSRDWLLVPQVPLLAGSPFILDGLLQVQMPRRTFLDLEVDGKGHDARHDRRRARLLKMPTLRLLNQQKSLAEALRGIGYLEV